ncbi:hypothetical protein MLD38_009385 [Melastoma candidum]|uniref:Uncharacterized protein n=1 Tax=Melastoma candidum TaxID=119954 RepID=A0ACB9RXJ7_9MYRT|nr:hypothetical protein MLD38_009385 [Melastoma candidum]
MSSLPLPQQQQPAIAYPATGAGQLLPSPSSYTNDNPDGGSYTKAFVILGVIVLLCFIAGCFGRFYGRRFEKPKPLAQKKAAVFPREKESDIEFGFDHKKIRTANRPLRYGDLGGHKPMPNGSGDSLNQGNKRHFDRGGPAITFSIV